MSRTHGAGVAILGAGAADQVPARGVVHLHADAACRATFNSYRSTARGAYNWWLPDLIWILTGH